MSQSQQNGAAKEAEGPIRKSFLVTVLLMALILIGGVVILLRTGPSQKEGSQPTEESVSVPSTVTEEEPVLVQATNSPALPVTPARTVRSNFAPAPPKMTAAVENRPVRTEPSAYTKRLMDILSDVDPKSPMTPEKVAQWKQALQQLVQEGAGALPAIQQFLDKNQDIKLDSGEGTNSIGESSLRTVLIKTLDSIGGPEAIAFEAQWLQSTMDPNEIALLARQLEKQAPEQYRQMAVEAAQSALSMAASGKLADRDVGPLFGLLQQYGDANSVEYLKSLTGKWKYYGAIALAQLPNGAGVPALAEMVNETKPGPTRDVGFWMLAQGVDSDLAQSTLLDQAQKSTIPCPTWIEISSILSGNDFHIGSAAAEGRLPRAGERSWRLNNGNQNFYSTPRTDPWTVEQINRRLALLAQLLAANRNCPEAVEWLQKARADLQAKMTP